MSSDTIQLIVGSFMTPKDSPSGPISYENSYRRAQKLGFPSMLAPPPQSAVVWAWHFQITHMMLILLLLMLPLVFRFRISFPLAPAAQDRLPRLRLRSSRHTRSLP